MSRVIDRNEARLPFFGDKLTFVLGLDPLGLQNPSSQAYSYLLPGLNNVTGRIRNYSFYCWLLNEFAKRIKNDDPREQKKFIRKAEYIIALVAVKAEIEGISGSLYATKRLHEDPIAFNLDTGTYNADGSTENTYWQYSFGIFGQYYLGSLRQIGLVDEPINGKGEPLGIYRRTAKQDKLKVSGEELATAFEENISSSNKQLFFQCLEQGTIDHHQLQQLAQDFDLTKIKPQSKEANLLIELLLDIDEPSIVKGEQECMRKQTLMHVLQYVSSHSTPLDQRAFTMYAYDVKGVSNASTNACLTGWYYYQLNEYWQVACTGIFNGALDYLEKLRGPGWMPLYELITEASSAIIEFLVENGIIESDTETIAPISAKGFGTEKQLYERIRNERIVARMAHSFILIWKLHEQNKDNLLKLRDYTKARQIGGNNDVLSFYLDYNKYLQHSIRKFIEDFLLHKIIYRHQYVAYQKMGSGSQSTQKFIIEDNYIRHIGNFQPGFTGPRVGNLIAFLRDLNLLDESYKLTDTSNQLLILQG